MELIRGGLHSDTDGDGRLSFREIKSFIDDFYSKNVDESRLKVSYAISSSPDIVLLSKDAIPPTDKPRRKLVAVLVGVGKYQISQYDLPGIDEDIKNVTALLTSDKLLVSDSTIRLLQDEEATYDNVMEAFDWLAETSVKEDLAVFYFSGHTSTVPGPRSLSVLTLK